MKSFFILILTCSCTIAVSQRSTYADNIDSLKQMLHEPSVHDSTALNLLWQISEAYYYYHDDSLDLAIEYADELVRYADSINKPSWVGSGYNNKGRILGRMENLEEALDAYRKGMESYLEDNDSLRYMLIYDNTSFILSDMGRYDEALTIKKKAVDYFRIHSDSNTIAASLYGVGAVYIAKEEYERAIPYHREALRYTHDWPLLEGEAYSDLLIMNRNIGNYDSLSYYYRKSLAQMATIESSVALLHYNYGEAKELMGQPDSAVIYMRKAIAAKGQDHQGEEYNLFKLGLAKLLAEKGQTAEARRLLDQAAIYVKDTENLKHRQRVHGAEYAVLQAEGRYKEALVAVQKLHAAKEEATAIDVEKNFQEIETKYETAKKNQQIAELAMEDKLNEARLRNRNRWLGALGLGLLGLLGLLYRIFKQKSVISDQKEQLSKSLAEKNVLLKEIHHRVKNNLQVISSLLGLQSRFVQDDAAQKALSVGKSRVQSMSLLHQKLYTNKDLKSVNIKSYFEDLIDNLMSTYQIAKGAVTFTTDIADIDLDIDTVVPLGLITNELISNALKHAFDDEQHGEVAITVTSIDGIVEMIVKDNGRGVPFTTIPQKTKSLGLQLIRSFTNKLNGTLTIDNTDGSTFTIAFDPSKSKS